MKFKLLFHLNPSYIIPSLNRCNNPDSMQSLRFDLHRAKKAFA